MGIQFSAADILLHGLNVWFPAGTPDDPLIQDWVERCKARPASVNAYARDAVRVQAA